MIVIQGLKELPQKIKNKDYLGHEFGCQCPCYHRATQGSPAYCSILALIKDSFNADPDNYECPLKEVSEN